MEKSSVAETSSGLESTLKKLDPTVESAVPYDVANCLTNSKRRKFNLSGTQQKALKSLKAKSRDVKILPADKGNAAVVNAAATNSTRVRWKNTFALAPTLCSKKIPRNLCPGNWMSF